MRSFITLFLFAVSLLNAPGVWAKQIRLSPASDLEAAIKHAAVNDVLLFSSGIYSGPLVINKSLTLKAESGAIFDGHKKGNILLVRAPNVTIEGFVLRNSGMNLTKMNAAIFVKKTAKNILIKNNVFKNNLFGVWLDAAHDATVIGNKISADQTVRSQDRGNGIHLYHVEGADIAKNEIWHTRDGIYIDTSNNNVLKNNNLHDLRYGIHYMYSNHNRIEGNYTHNTRTGYALMQSNSLTVLNNRSENDENYGILMNYITYSTLKNNRVEHVRKGITPGYSGAGITGAEGKALFIYNSVFNTLEGNLFADSDIGIHLTAGSEKNSIYDNAFVNNYTQVKYVSNRRQEWSKDGRGNYWSNYLGWDRNDDGIGDRPFEPNDNVDKLLWKYPLAKLLMNSPSVQILRWAQMQFPVFKSPGITDSYPLMQPLSSETGARRISSL
ncbi:MAG TPA: nitrous oxide reductase family maturation protein NosD [Gammaproteobacteria bacterium]|nr:nitrous oxide reductase family maturation protein NosD [Gammaproteobacteria bacterium]